jgi:hypothetical protein
MQMGISALTGLDYVATPSRPPRVACVMTEVPTEDQRRRSDKDGPFLYTCAVCGRMFLSRRNLASAAGARISVCGAILSPLEAHCMLANDFGEIWWLPDVPMPDLLEIQRFYDGRERLMGLSY